MRRLELLDERRAMPNTTETIANPASSAAEPVRVDSTLIVQLTQTALAANDIPSAVTPVLDALVNRTEAVGSAYFQSGGEFYFARAASGDLPEGPAMEAIVAHGLPADTPLLEAIRRSSGPVFYDDTRASNDTAGFPDLGVASIAAAPVRKSDGDLAGAFLMHTFRPHCWTDDECNMFEIIASTLATLTARFVAEEEVMLAREDALRAIGLAVERRDSETKGHTDRVVEFAVTIASKMNLGPEETHAIRWGSYLHDIGKIGIPDRILHKPGKLTDAEWAIMRQHSEYGHEFASRLGFLPGMTLDLILHHHERWSGGGYPANLSGTEIPISARIFAICDVYDALVSKRSYKPAWTHDAAMTEILGETGRHFDPEVVAAFTSSVHQLNADRGSER